MKKLFTLLLGAASIFSVTEQATAQNTFVTPPADAKSTLYCRNSLDLMFTNLGTIDNFEYYGYAQELLEDGDDVYLKNPIACFAGFQEYYIKGKKTATGLEFPLPQEVFTTDNNGTQYTFMVDMYYYDPSTGDYFIDNMEPRSYDLELQPNGSYKFDYLGYHSVNTMWGTTFYTDRYLGLVEKGSNDWVGYSELTCRLIPFDSADIAVPSDMETKEYQFIYDVNGHKVKIGTTDSEIYIQGLNDTDPTRWIKGSFDGKTALIPSGQYTGIAAGQTIFITGAENIGTDENPIPENTANVELSYDAENDVWTAENLIRLCNSPELDETTGLFLSSIFRPVPATFSPVPAQPEFVPGTFMNWSQSMEMGYVRVQLSSLNVDGDVLPTDRLSYAFFIDDELYWLDPADFTQIDEEMAWIPFDYTDYWDIHIFPRGLRLFYFYAQVEDTFAVQMRYQDEEGNYHYSSKYTINADGQHLGVNGVAADADVVSEQLYDISGRAVSKDHKGMVIRMQKMADGTVKALKQNNIR